jgi:flagellar FliJ protein
MKPFTMEPVLNYRQQLEDVAKQKLHAALEEEDALLQQITAVKDALTDLFRRLETARTKGTTVDMLVLFENRIVITNEQLTKMQKEHVILKQKIKRRRKELLSTSKDRKILEKLRDQQNLAYRKYIDKKENAALDEIAVLFHER